MRTKRPVYLNIFRIRQPLPAIVSILHRISGAVMFLLLPLLLYGFQQSLASEADFLALRNHGWARPVFMVALGLYLFHFFAGLRFLAFDLHRPGLYAQIRSSAWLVLMAAALSTVVIGAWLW